VEKKKSKGKTPKQMKKDCWDLFSKMVRLKYSYDDGLCQCYTCGKIDLWKNLQAGHGIGGRGNYILFQDDVVRPQCYYCNGPLRGNYEIFVPKLIGEIGAKRYNEHLDASRQVCKLPKGFYEDKIIELKELLAKLPN